LKNLKIYGSTKSISKRKIQFLIKNLSELLNFSTESLEINFINANKIEEINSKYLNHNYSTDIITFNYSENKKILDGEIFISIDDAFTNSEKFKISFNLEITRLVIHGILHLLGYDDQNPKDKIKMKRKENKLLNTLKFILL
jgi:probable rRNA maturation factor